MLKGGKMIITKFDHSGFLLEKDGRGLLFDSVEDIHFGKVVAE